MALKEKIEQDLIGAMKSKDELRVSVLRMLKTAIKNAEIQKRAELGDDDIYALIGGQIKSRREAIELYKKGGREELAQKEEAEIKILQNYLPEQIGEEEIRRLVKNAITAVGAGEIKDMGKVMAKIMPEVKGKADGALVSQIVKEELS